MDTNISGERYMIFERPFSPFQQKMWNSETGTGYIGNQQKKLFERTTSAAILFGKIAKKWGFDNPLEAYRGKTRDAVIADFCKEASTRFTSWEIEMVKRKYSYPVKLESYYDVSSDQAAAAITFATSTTLDWFRALQGGTPIVESSEKRMLNGIFGRRDALSYVIEDKDVKDEVADTFYIIKHTQNRDLPQPPWIVFDEVAEKSTDFEAARLMVIEHRKKFEEVMRGSLPNHYFKVIDAKHGGNTKFRLTCRVFDKERSRMMVVSEETGKATPFATWAQEHLNDILSCDNKELAAIAEAAKKADLMSQLTNPRNNDPTYRPWANLLEQVQDYKKAVAIWRYALIHLEIKNITEFEHYWEKEGRDVDQSKCAVYKDGCSDGRHSKDGGVLAAIRSKTEFTSTMVTKTNEGLEEYDADLHYNCGDTTTLHKGAYFLFKFLAEEYVKDRVAWKSQKFANSDERGRARYKAEHDYDRNLKTMSKYITDLRKREGSVIDGDILADYLPSSIKAEYQAFLKGEKALDEKHRGMVSVLHKIFASRDETLRAVVRRALEVGVLEQNMDSVIRMPDAETTYRKLKEFFGEEYQDKFSFNLINAFVTEEIARQVEIRYNRWMEDLPPRNRVRKLVILIDNFVTGQSTMVPPAPTSAKDFENLERHDYHINSGLYSPEEIAAFGLEGKRVWRLPA